MTNGDYNRQWNVLEKTYLMNLIKERLCYVSLDFL